MRFVDEMLEYCSASTHDCPHEQLSMAREALVISEQKLDRMRQEYDEMQAKMVLKVQDLEVKLHEADSTVQCLRQDQASWLKRMAALAVLFVSLFGVCLTILIELISGCQGLKMVSSSSLPVC